jgi:hypothetical protein
MNGTKPLSVCVLIVLFGNGSVPAHAQAPEAITQAPNAVSPTERVPAEESVLSEPSKQAAKPEAAAADFCRCVGEGDNSTSRKIEKALATPLHQTGLDYADQPLEDITTQLADEYGIPVQINKAALEEAGISTDTRINISIHNVSLRSALRLMLKPSQLTYVIENEVLSITTKEDAESELKLCVYDVRRLAGDKGDLSPLIDTISSCVAKDTWAKNGRGSAEIRSPKPGLLVITQTQAVHNYIRNLLKTLDEMRHDGQGNVGSAPIKAATTGSAERRTPANPAGSGAARNENAPGQPVRSATDLDPFSG